MACLNLNSQPSLLVEAVAQMTYYFSPILIIYIFVNITCPCIFQMLPVLRLNCPHQFADSFAVPRRLSYAGVPSASQNDAGTTSTVAPVGPNKEVEYFFASDARYDVIPFQTTSYNVVIVVFSLKNRLLFCLSMYVFALA